MKIGDVADISTTTRFMDEVHRQVQETARQYAMEEVMPAANEYDIKGFQGETMPEELMYDRPAELNLHGMMIPEEYGGAGLDVLSYAVATEEIARAWASAASIYARSQGIPGATEEQKEKYYPKMADGEIVGATALTEPGGGSDAGNIECVALKDEDEYVINGQKMWCTNAKDADFIVLYAATDPKAEPKHRGVSAFIIEKPRGEFPEEEGLSGRHLPTLGYHGMNSFELTFDDYHVHQDQLVGGEEGQGFYQIMDNFEIARVHTAARAIGAARGALEDSIEYAAERTQFGQPIKEFQGVSFKIADMATQVEAARHLTHHVAKEKEEGHRCDLEACMCKLFASEMALDVCEEGIQILASNGYSMDYPMQRYYRDARLWTIGEGTSNIQRRVIKDRIYGE